MVRHRSYRGAAEVLLARQAHRQHLLRGQPRVPLVIHLALVRAGLEVAGDSLLPVVAAVVAVLDWDEAAGADDLGAASLVEGSLGQRFDQR